ncbi:hypothetical protein ACHHYP_03341 [Achlya hypogyna]|uniref:Uncharacterized protein n=1 Tax=Achlya hypogyna TaxID=1202772 RepID=A0A1V9Z3Y4_ACHHY|nr:hypothetical protein ACHHYP_03341 [Achlya hypogyna]
MPTSSPRYGALATVFKEEHATQVIRDLDSTYVPVISVESPVSSRPSLSSPAGSPIRGSRRFRAKSETEREQDESHMRDSISGDSSTGRWTTDEQEAFVEGLNTHGKDWKKIAAMIPTRTLMQIRTHAQKYFKKMEREQRLNAQNSTEFDDLILEKSRWSVSNDDVFDSDSDPKRPLTGERRHRSGSVPSPDTNGRRDSDPRQGLVKGKISKPSPQPKRAGRWTKEEEDYATGLIREFDRGTLPLPDGMLLRVFLAATLQCDPMRISKKFAGVLPKAKQAFMRDPTRLTAEELTESRRALAVLERRFFIATGQTEAPPTALPSTAEGFEDTENATKEDDDDDLDDEALDFLMTQHMTTPPPIEVVPFVCSPPVLGNRRNSLEANERRLHVEIEDLAAIKMSESRGDVPLYSPIKNGYYDLLSPLNKSTFHNVPDALGAIDDEMWAILRED